MISGEIVKSIYSFLKKNYPEQLPSTASIKKYEDILNLGLSHFTTNLVYRDIFIDIRDITYIEVNNQLIHIDDYKKILTPLMLYKDLILIMKFPNLLPVTRLPSLQVQRILFRNKMIIPKTTSYENTHYKYKNNHYRISSFVIQDNSSELSEVIRRLWKMRDTHSTIHFHLEGNFGGDLIVVHLILICLCGGKQGWMTPYEVSEINSSGKKIKRKWDPWSVIPTKGYEEQYAQLKIDYESLPTFTDKYNGKIVLHIDPRCGSSTWFFITYIIYVFSNKIERFVKDINGIPIKLGRVSGPQIELRGTSNTTSGDGNTILKMFVIEDTKMQFKFPTQANLDRPVELQDWNRFWTGEF